MAVPSRVELLESELRALPFAQLHARAETLAREKMEQMQLLEQATSTLEQLVQMHGTLDARADVIRSRLELLQPVSRAVRASALHSDAALYRGPSHTSPDAPASPQVWQVNSTAGAAMPGDKVSQAAFTRALYAAAPPDVPAPVRPPSDLLYASPQRQSRSHSIAGDTVSTMQRMRHDPAPALEPPRRATLAMPAHLSSYARTHTQHRGLPSVPERHADLAPTAHVSDRDLYTQPQEHILAQALQQEVELAAATAPQKTPPKAIAAAASVPPAATLVTERMIAPVAPADAIGVVPTTPTPPPRSPLDDATDAARAVIANARAHARVRATSVENTLTELRDSLRRSTIAALAPSRHDMLAAGMQGVKPAAPELLSPSGTPTASAAPAPVADDSVLIPEDVFATRARELQAAAAMLQHVTSSAAVSAPLSSPGTPTGTGRTLRTRLRSQGPAALMPSMREGAAAPPPGMTPRQNSVEGADLAFISPRDGGETSPLKRSTSAFRYPEEDGSAPRTHVVLMAARSAAGTTDASLDGGSHGGASEQASASGGEDDDESNMRGGTPYSAITAAHAKPGTPASAVASAVAELADLPLPPPPPARKPSQSEPNTSAAAASRPLVPAPADPAPAAAFEARLQSMLSLVNNVMAEQGYGSEDDMRDEIGTTGRGRTASTSTQPASAPARASVTATAAPHDVHRDGTPVATAEHGVVARQYHIAAAVSASRPGTVPPRPPPQDPVAGIAPSSAPRNSSVPPPPPSSDTQPAAPARQKRSSGDSGGEPYITSLKPKRASGGGASPASTPAAADSSTAKPKRASGGAAPAAASIMPAATSATTSAARVKRSSASDVPAAKSAGTAAATMSDLAQRVMSDDAEEVDAAIDARRRAMADAMQRAATMGVAAPASPPPAPTTSSQPHFTEHTVTSASRATDAAGRVKRSSGSSTDAAPLVPGAPIIILKAGLPAPAVPPPPPGVTAAAAATSSATSSLARRASRRVLRAGEAPEAGVVETALASSKPPRPAAAAAAESHNNTAAAAPAAAAAQGPPSAAAMFLKPRRRASAPSPSPA